MEILGCGMVHPAVLENCKLDSERYTGWAFGMGPHRITMLRYRLPDIRLLLEGDMRFLSQLGRAGRQHVNISIRWLEDFLRRPLDPPDVAERLTMLGAPVDAIEPLHTDLGDIVVALVEEVRPHPNADRLAALHRQRRDGRAAQRGLRRGQRHRRTQVSLRPTRRDIARRAQDREPQDPGRDIGGDAVLRARAGAGTGSRGHSRSRDRLRLPGTPLLKALPLADHRLVVDVGPNRPDLLCHKGIARELSASYGTPFRLPVIPRTAGGRHSALTTWWRDADRPATSRSPSRMWSRAPDSTAR